ncbi:hypothetical protein II898_03925 [bacterium]|nr:hypothetical protein [bacterium]
MKENFNKLLISAVLLLAFALGNGCGGDGQYPYQEQQGGGAEYIIGTGDGEGEGIFSCLVPKEEEEEVHERARELCEKLRGSIFEDGEIRGGLDHSGNIISKNVRAGSVSDEKTCVQLYCFSSLPEPSPVVLENTISEFLANAGLDWKEYPYRITHIQRLPINGYNLTDFVIIMKNLVIKLGANETKSCLESYPEYSQVIFQNGECNGQNPTRNYVPENDKHIISKTDIDDVHKKNKDICNKISGHDYTRGETEIIDDNNVTFMDGCDVDVYKEIWTENVIAELFNRKGLTEIPYKINFIWADKPSGKYKSTVVGIKIPNMDIFVTLHKTKSCLLSCPACNVFGIEPNPQVNGYGECIQKIRKESEENTSAYFKKDKQR